jgi:virulence factor Mce-like protein
MRRRGRGGSVIANPVLVGAVTTLVVAVGVFLAYNANNGLPFVPTYKVSVLVPDGGELVAGNDVRVGGRRVGQVSAIEPVLRNGVAFARLDLKVQKSLADLPVDTGVAIRQRSNIGLKYLELRPGRDRRTIPDGGLLRTSNVLPVTDLDDVLNAFNKPTREGFATTLSEFGGGLAGRGADLNASLAALPGVIGHLDTVMTTLAEPRTDLRGFIRGLDSGLGAIAPVSAQLADALDAGATTFAAIQPGDLRATIDETVATEQVGTPALAQTRPLLRAAANLLVAARPGLVRLPTAAPVFSRALAVLTPPLARARALARDIAPVVSALERVSRLPDTAGAIDRLTDTLKLTTPALTFINPMQTTCNYLGLWTRNVSSIASQGDALGTWFRFTPIGVAAEELPSAAPSSSLHVVPNPDTGQNGQCEVGNENYQPGQVIGAVPGVQPGHAESTAPGTVYEQVAREGPQR